MKRVSVKLTGQTLAVDREAAMVVVFADGSLAGTTDQGLLLWGYAAGYWEAFDVDDELSNART